MDGAKCWMQKTQEERREGSPLFSAFGMRLQLFHTGAEFAVYVFITVGRGVGVPVGAGEGSGAFLAAQPPARKAAIASGRIFFNVVFIRRSFLECGGTGGLRPR